MLSHFEKLFPEIKTIIKFISPCYARGRCWKKWPSVTWWSFHLTINMKLKQKDRQSSQPQNYVRTFMKPWVSAREHEQAYINNCLARLILFSGHAILLQHSLVLCKGTFFCIPTSLYLFFSIFQTGLGSLVGSMLAYRAQECAFDPLLKAPAMLGG